MELSFEQKQIIDTNDKSLLVSASAGSGKTFVVIQKIIESIKKGADVGRLLVLTFTNAAASELKERLLTSLHGLKDEYLKAGDGTNAKRIAKQIAKVPMADISTIHSFCLNIIRNNFYSLGLDPNIATLDATKSTIMINEAITEVIEQEYDEANQEFLDILDILGNEENVISTIYMLYNAYRNVLYQEKWLEDTIATYSTKSNVDLSQIEIGKIILNSIKNKLLMLKLELEYIIDKLDALEDFETRKQMLGIMLNNINRAINTSTYDELYNLLEEILVFPRLPSTKVTDDELKEQVKQIKSKVQDELKDIAQIMYKDSFGVIQELNDSLKYINWYIKVLKQVEEKYTIAKRKNCSIDFSDYEHLALKALEDENVKEKYKQKYEYIYVDEYQDTSYAQEAIIQKIAKDNNVIMVGDVKQSIYAFRNAKPELFTNKYESFKELEDAPQDTRAKIILARNFRSRKEVLNSTNSIFKLLMSKDFGGTRYEDKEELAYGEGYDCSLGQNYITEVNIIEKQNNTEESQGIEAEEKIETNNEEYENILDIELEANLVGQRIRKLVDEKFQVYDLKSKEYRPIKYKDIVILLRAVENKADKVGCILAKYDIPSFADSKTGFYKSEEITLITSFLKVLDNPYQDVPLVSVMYSIIGKFDLDELAIIRHKNSSIPVIESLKICSEKLDNCDLKNKIKKFLEFLEKYKNYLKTYNISYVLLKLYNETGIYEALRSESLGEIKCANLDNFIQIIFDFEKSEASISLHSLVKYLDVLKNKETAGDSPKLIGENEDVVRIMTVHKSKGLEFPVVILMNTAAKYNEQDTKDKLQFDETLGIGIDIYNKEQGITYPSVIKQAIKLKSKRVLRSEALRVLYVALTRAKEKLIICGTVPSLESYISKMSQVKNKETSELVAASCNSHLKCILQAALTSEDKFEVLLHKINDLTVKSEDATKYVDRNKHKLSMLKECIKKHDITKIDCSEKIKNIKEHFERKEETVSINKKYTVTELKASETDMKEIKPEVLNTKVSGASYGTLVHSVIEHLDYNDMSQVSVSKVVDRVLDSLNIQDDINKNRVVKEILDMYDIIYCYLHDAQSIKNELEFVIEDKLDSIEEVKFEAPTMIQGVVDMYVVTHDGKHIIIDFKTDKVVESYELIQRYNVQLKVYKRAIELGYNVKVDGIYIYSFALKQLIEVVD